MVPVPPSVIHWTMTGPEAALYSLGPSTTPGGGLYETLMWTINPTWKEIGLYFICINYEKRLYCHYKELKSLTVFVCLLVAQQPSW